MAAPKRCQILLSGAAAPAAKECGLLPSSGHAASGRSTKAEIRVASSETRRAILQSALAPLVYREFPPWSSASDDDGRVNFATSQRPAQTIEKEGYALQANKASSRSREVNWHAPK